MDSNEEVKPLSSGTVEVSPLLDEATVARIRSKELEVNARAEAVTERRTDAKKLKDALRLEELRAIPQRNRAPDAQREFTKLERRRQRAKAPKAAALSNIETAEEFWAANRLTADTKKIKAWKEQEEIVLDQIFWMNEGWECPAPDPYFVSADDGVDLLDDHIATHGVIHDDPVSYKHQILQDFQPFWGVWATKTIYDPIWKTIEGFWRDSEVFRALCNESPATEVFARYGIQTALPAYAVRRFKERIATHRSGVGHEAHAQYDGEKCWLCRCERLHGTQR